MQIPAEILTDGNLTLEERFLFGYYHHCYSTNQIEKTNNQDTLEKLNLQYQKLNKLRNSLLEKGYIFKEKKNGVISLGKHLDSYFAEQDEYNKNDTDLTALGLEKNVVEETPVEETPIEENETPNGMRYDLYQFVSNYSIECKYDGVKVSIEYPNSETVNNDIDTVQDVAVGKGTDVEVEQQTEEVREPIDETIIATEQGKVMEEWHVLKNEIKCDKAHVADRKVTKFINEFPGRFGNNEDAILMEKQILEDYFHIWKTLER